MAIAQRPNRIESEDPVQLLARIEREVRRVLPEFRLSTVRGETDAVIGKLVDEGSATAAWAAVLDILWKKKLVAVPDVYAVYAQFAKARGKSQGEDLLSAFGKQNPNAALTLKLIDMRGTDALTNPLPMEKYASRRAEDEGYAVAVRFLNGRGLATAVPVLRKQGADETSRESVRAVFKTPKGTVIVTGDPILIQTLLRAKETGQNVEAVKAAITYGAYNIIRRRKSGERRTSVAPEDIRSLDEPPSRFSCPTVPFRVPNESPGCWQARTKPI